MCEATCWQYQCVTRAVSARRMRERNRIAQQRYRNRQRFRLQESEQKVAELTERVRMLTSDKVRGSGKGHN